MQHGANDGCIPTILLVERSELRLKKYGEILILDPGIFDRERFKAFRFVFALDDFGGGEGDGLGPFGLEEGIPERVGVPFSLDRDAVRAKQLVDD